MNKFITNIKLNLRGIKEINIIHRHYFTFEIAKNFFIALQPFINIYFFALIVDGISQQKSFSYLLILAGITISLNLLAQVIIERLNYHTTINYNQFYALYTMRLNKKTISLPYVKIEDPATFQHRQSIDEYSNMNGAGLFRLLWSLPGLIQYCLALIASITLTLGLFLAPSVTVEGTFLNFVVSPLASSLLVLLIIMKLWVSFYVNTTFYTKFYKIMDGFITVNRIFNFYFKNYISSYQAGKEIRIYKQDKLILGEMEKVITFGKKFLNNIATMQVKYFSFSAVVALLVMMLVYLFIALRAYAGMISLGDIVLYVASVTAFIGAFDGFMEALTQLKSNEMPLQRYFDYIDLPEADEQGDQPLKKDQLKQFQFEIKNLSFKYPTSQEYIIKNLSLVIKSSQRIAIVGQNGSGKTTLIKLLCRLFEDYEGEILLNGIEIRQYDYEQYQAMLAVVFQDFQLFAFSLGQNVAVEDDYDVQKVEEVLHEAGFNQRLNNLNQGLKTTLYKDFDEDGVMISGGEAQKIAIARAFYKDAPLVILDEPTAALDPIAESEIYERINKLVVDRSVIFISHRLSSCKFSDMIILLDHGQLLQHGTHEQLIEVKDGKYYAMWQAQAQWYQ